MITSLENPSGLGQMLFQKRFPVPKAQPLFDGDAPKAENTGNAPSSGEPQENSVATQGGFSQVMQGMMHVSPANEKKQDGIKGQKETGDQSIKEEHTEIEDAYGPLLIKARYNFAF